MSKPELDDPKDPENYIPGPLSPIRIAFSKWKAASKAFNTSIIMLRETSLANEQRAFIHHSILHDTRLDGRKLDEYRKLEIGLADYGHVDVQLGHTS